MKDVRKQKLKVFLIFAKLKITRVQEVASIFLKRFEWLENNVFSLL